MKNIILLIVVVSVLFSVGGCSEDPKATKNNTVASSAETTENTKLTSPHAPVNFDCEFTVLCWGLQTATYNNYFDIHAESMTGDIINDAVYSRNSEIEEKYNIKITAVENGTVAMVEAAVMSGDDLYSSVMFGMQRAMSLAKNGNLIEVGALDNISTDAVWWNSELSDSLSVSGRSYVLMGDMNMQQWTQNALVYFNKNIASANGIDDIYQLVEDKRWTFEKFSEYSSKIYIDLNGNSLFDENDMYGTVLSNFGVPSFLYGFGMSYVSKSGKGHLSLNIEDKLFNAYEKTYLFCHESSTLYTDFPQYTKNRAQITWDSFMNGWSLFLVEKFDIYSKLRNMEEPYGLLPMPLYDESQLNYYTWTHSLNGATVAVPVSVEENEMISIVLDDMAFFSMQYVRPAYYEMMLERKLSQDEESSNIVPIIVNGVIYDISGVVLDINNILREAVDDGRNSITSLMAAYKSSMQKTLDDLAVAFDALE